MSIKVVAALLFIAAASAYLYGWSVAAQAFAISLAAGPLIALILALLGWPKESTP
jgi:hypothetical protein